MNSLRILLPLMIMIACMAACDKKSSSVTPKTLVNPDSTATAQYPDTDIYVGYYRDSLYDPDGGFYDYALQAPFTFYVIHLNDTMIEFVNGGVFDIYEININDTFKQNNTNTYVSYPAINTNTITSMGAYQFVMINDSLSLNWQYIDWICTDGQINTARYAGKLQSAAAR